MSISALRRPAPYRAAATRTLVVSALLALFALAACAKAPADADSPPTGDVYGEGVQAAKVVSISEILADPKVYAGQRVRVESMVTDVCPKRGCWFDMAGDKPGQKLRFKVQDGIMVFPMDAKGKRVSAEGVVSLQPMTLEQTRKYLAYQAAEYGSDVDPDSVTEPMTMVRLDGKGAVIHAQNPHTARK